MITNTLEKQEIINFLRKLTAKEVALLKLMIERPICVSTEKFEDIHEVGGIIGSLLFRKFKLIKVLRRNERGKNVYGIDENVLYKSTLLECINSLESY